jgi:hypothetical protein
VGELGLRPSARLAGRSQETTIFYRSQEALELLRVIPKTIDVKSEHKSQEDLTTKKRLPFRPNLDAEADIKIADVTPSSKAQEEQMEREHRVVTTQNLLVDSNDVGAPGTKRKRNATSESSSTSKKVKRDESSVRPELTSYIQTRSKARLAAQRKSKVVNAAVVDRVVHEEGRKGDSVATWLFGRLTSVWTSLTQGRAAL